MATTSEPNPKQIFGNKKPPLMQLPLVAVIHASMAHYDGELKYGFRNWREHPVEALTYLNAAMRHLQLWTEGEEYARDTGVNNLGSVIACCAILLDAQLNHALIDNRSKSSSACDLLHNIEHMVRNLQEQQEARAQLKLVTSGGKTAKK